MDGQLIGRELKVEDKKVSFTEMWEDTKGDFIIVVIEYFNK
jgi:hypothetical protein